IIAPLSTIASVQHRHPPPLPSMRPAKPAASAAGEESGKPLPPTSPPGCSPSSQSYQLLWTSMKVHILTILNNPRSESRRCW
ncbi:unnamed protein product, partial [Musa textilis]